MKNALLLCILLLTTCTTSNCLTMGRPRPPVHVTVSSSSPSPPTAPSPSSPSAPTCQPASSDLRANMVANICPSCIVVVNQQTTTAAACTIWSPTAFWIPSSNICAERCERLAGSLIGKDAKGRTICLVDQQPIAAFNASSSAPLASVPIACGTWLGQQESMWKQSWFTSQCAAIVTAPQIAAAPCDERYYTDGCRMITTSTSEPLRVPNCRQGNTYPCGVSVPCPNPNPCGLSSTVSANRFKTSCKNSQLYVALDTGRNESTCLDWIPTATWTDDSLCISSCGNTDGACILDGVTVPQCDTTTQEICAVPMPTNVWTGKQNAFMGRSTYNSGSNVHCYARLSATPQHNDIQSQLLWFISEGLFFSPVLIYNQTEINSLPACIGQPSSVCKVEIPCYNDANDVQVAKQCAFNPFLSWLGVAYSTPWCNYIIAKFIMTLVAWIFLFLDGLIPALNKIQFEPLLLKKAHELFSASLKFFVSLCKSDTGYTSLDRPRDNSHDFEYSTVTIAVFYAVNLGPCILLAEAYLIFYAIFLCCRAN